MSLQQKTLKNVLLAALLVTAAGVTLGFSKNILRGYVLARFCFLFCGAAVFATGLAGAWLGDDQELKGSRWFLLVLAGQAIALAVSVLVSIMPWVSLLGSVPRMMGAVTYWSYLLIAAGTVLAISSRKSRLVIVLRLLMILAAVVAVHSLFEIPTVRGFRPPGLLGNPDFLGNWLVVVFISGLSLMLIEKSLPAVLLAGAGTSLGLISLVLSQTRGAWLGLGVSMVVFFALARPLPDSAPRVRRRMYLWAISTAALVGCLLLIYKAWGEQAVVEMVEKTPRVTLEQSLPRFHRRTRTGGILVMLATGALVIWSQLATRWRDLSRRWKWGVFAGFAAFVLVSGATLFGTKPGNEFRKKSLRLEFKNEGRKIIWRDTVTGMVPAYWHKGCGIETFRVAFLPYKSIDLAINGPKQNWRNPHNVILYELTSNGVLGLATYLAVVLFAFFAFVRARRMSLNTPFGLLVTGCLASFSGYLVHNLFNYDVVATGFAMYLMVGIGQATKMIARRDEEVGGATDGSQTVEAEASTSNEAPSKKKKKAKKRAKRKQRRQRAAAQPTSQLLPIRILGAIWLIPLVYGLSTGRASSWWAAWLLFVPLLFWLALEVRTNLWATTLGLTEAGRKLERLDAKTAVGLAASYSVFWIPLGLAFVTTDWLHEAMQRDTLPLLMTAVVEGCWVLMALAPRRMWAVKTEADKDASSTYRLSRGRLAATGAIALLAVAGAGWYCSKQVVADWGLHRAKGFSKVVDRRLNPRLAKINGSIRSLTRRIRAAEKRGVPPQKLAEARKKLTILKKKKHQTRDKISELVKKIVHNGRMGTSHFKFMGFFHHQYSKSLQPFVRSSGQVDDELANELMMEAVAHAEQAVRNNTNPESAYSHLAVMHYWSMRFCDQDSRGATTRACKRKRFEKAKAALRKSIGHDRFYYDTHRMMAFMMVKQGDLDKAVREIKLSKKIIRNRLHKFRNVKQVDKMVKRALLRDGYKLAREGKHQEAILAYETALERYGEPMPEAHHLMGVSYLKLDRHSMAEKQLSKAIKQDRRLHAARIDLAKLRFAQGRESRAFDILGSLLRPKVKEPDALLVRAWAYEKRGKNELAVRDLRRYLRADPNSRKARRVRKKLKELLRR